MSRASWVVRLAAGAAAVVLAGCSAQAQSPTGTSPPSPTPSTSKPPGLTPSPTPSPKPSPTPAPKPTKASQPVPVSTATAIRTVQDDQWRRIVATGTWRPGCPVTRGTLRDVDVPYRGFDGATHRGLLVVNADVATSVAAVFARLYREGYPVRSIVPVERFGGDDNASMAADNTSAFNCRRAGQANAPSAASPHANGRAVDVNPYENPWVDPRCGCFQPDAYFGTHRTNSGRTDTERAVITKGGAAWRAFVEAGWTWQDNSTPDFQHFDTGYPSRPLD